MEREMQNTAVGAIGGGGYGAERATRNLPQGAATLTPRAKDSQLAAHVLSDASALELAGRNLDRLKRLRVRLMGIHDLEAGPSDQPPQPSPEGILPHLQQIAGEMEHILSQTSKVLDQLDAAA